MPYTCRDMNIPQDFELVELARKVGQRLAAAKLTLAAAESCTGGLIGHLITENAGCSCDFMGSAVVYSYAAKEGVLGRPRHAARRGLRSATRWRARWRRLTRLFDTDVALAVTGIADRAAGCPTNPWAQCISPSTRDDYTDSRHFCWDADRTGKLLSAQAALDWRWPIWNAGKELQWPPKRSLTKRSMCWCALRRQRAPTSFLSA